MPAANHGKSPDEIEWAEPERQTRAVKEYLAALEAEVEPNPDRKPPKVISPSDPWLTVGSADSTLMTRSQGVPSGYDHRAETHRIGSFDHQSADPSSPPPTQWSHESPESLFGDILKPFSTASVIRVTSTLSRSLPLCARPRTCGRAAITDAMCHNRPQCSVIRSLGWHGSAEPVLYWSSSKTHFCRVRSALTAAALQSGWKGFRFRSLLKS